MTRKMQIILLVTGSRALKDYALVSQACDTFVCEACLRFAEKVTMRLLKHGDADGVDRLCARWAKANNIETLPFPAKWNVITGLPDDKLRIKYRDSRPYNALAGFNRNQEMIDSGFDVLLAIRCLGRSEGTDHAVRCVKATKKPIFIYQENGSYSWLA